jgi:hypothetical protein
MDQHCLARMEAKAGQVSHDCPIGLVNPEGAGRSELASCRILRVGKGGMCSLA